MPPDRNGPGFVYLLGNKDGWYRIGRTANPVERFRSRRWESMVNKHGLMPLFLLKVENQAHAEMFFHKLFDDKRTDARHNGMGPRHELFRLNSNDLATFLFFADLVAIKRWSLAGSWAVPDEVKDGI